MTRIAKMAAMPETHARASRQESHNAWPAICRSGSGYDSYGRSLCTYDDALIAGQNPFRFSTKSMR